MDKQKKNARQYIRDKEKTVFIGVKLQKSTDNDIIQFLDGKQKQTTFKTAIRYYMKKENNGGNEQWKEQHTRAL